MRASGGPASPASTTSATQDLVGIDARTASDPDVPAREEQSTTRGIPTSTASTASATLTVRLGGATTITASPTCTTPSDVVGKRAACTHNDRSAR
jgi:hypothetical protein